VPFGRLKKAADMAGALCTTTPFSWSSYVSTLPLALPQEIAYVPVELVVGPVGVPGTPGGVR
jgi:hypothetical protein